jgi:predicted  nucleic acid-binding Zn-ribbon protein
MNGILQNLLKLQTIEFGDATGKKAESEINELRGIIPQPILGHYDRLRVRGKKGLAVVRNQVCTGCHMRVPIGQITILMRSEDVQLCESCGRYLYLPDPAQSEPVKQAEAAKPAPKPVAKRVGRPRKRDVLAPAA